ncbi:GNAT family N-acetyltransferase [Aquihabitans sp. McL0605]|uniref:GNAT family N-acetyltransferase n=1 Tax=Aquihabitans sp. McL0605 TaxID=3415671 RepID=UPI003CED46C9
MLRPATTEDLPFLWEMLGHSSAPDGPPNTVEAMEAIPGLARYLDGWGRVGDTGLVAVDDETGERLGAAWYRSFPADAPGYGFIDVQTPEIAIACTPAARGRGTGHQLIEGLLARAHADGLARLSLSVRTTNVPAVRVYEDSGFVGVLLEPDGLHLTMAAPTHPEPAPDERLDIRSLAPGELDLSVLPPSEWGSTIVSVGVEHRVADLGALLAEIGGRPAGLLTWRRVEAANEIEVVGLEAWVRDRGVGSALLRAVRSEGRRLGVDRLWLITNNDNTDALRFYQRRGWDLVAVHRGGADRSRDVKPSIPLVGAHGIPVHHEVELELVVDPSV